MTQNAARTRQPAGLVTGGQFATQERAEADLALERRSAEQDARWAGVPSVDDFPPERRSDIDAVHRHSYDWAHERIGNLGMESADYAEDYAAWVTRRYMAADLDDDALGDHPRMAKEWDAERAATAARRCAGTPQETAWVEAMSRGTVLTTDRFTGSAAGRRERGAFTHFTAGLARRGVVVSEVRTVSRLGWTITALDADRYGEHVPTGP